MSYSNINLIVIGDRNWPGTPIYLEYLLRNGYQVKKILLCDFYESGSFRNKLEKAVHTVSPSLYKRAFSPCLEIYNPLLQELYSAFQSFFDFEVNLNLQEVNYHKYSDCIEKYKFWNFKDPNLLKILIKNKESNFLYISGGIVPKYIFEQGIRLIHVHPGYIPYTRGSDGLLWSLRIRGKLGYSCFFMNEHIDGGDLLYRHELELDDFSKYRPLISEHYEIFYRALLMGYDPHLRAKTLINTLQLNGGVLNRDKVLDKGNDEGREFFRMHPKLIKRTLLDYFK